MTKDESVIVKVRNTGTSKAITIPKEPQFESFIVPYLRVSVDSKDGRKFLKAEIVE